MEIVCMDAAHPLWQKTAEYAAACPWKAGAYLAELMCENRFAERERVFAVFDGEKAVGFCTLTAKDEMPETAPYTPFLGFLFVEPSYRGQGLAGRLIKAAILRAKSLGFSSMYVTSDEHGFYEKYGFTLRGTVINIRGTETQLFEIQVKTQEELSW